MMMEVEKKYIKIANFSVPPSIFAKNQFAQKREK